MSIMVAALLLAAAAPAGDGDPTLFYNGRCSLTLPEGWITIPPEDLENLTMWAANATYGQSVEVYQHGFIPSNFEPDRWLPNLLIQIRESGRLNSRRFLHLEPTDELRNTSKKNYPSGLPPLIMGVAVEDARFDPDRQCVRLEHALDLRFKGRIRVLTAAFLTERGLLTLHYTDRERRIAESRAIFDDIVDSVDLAPDLVYQPRLSDRWPGLPFFAAAAVVALALAAYLISRRRKP